VSHVAGRLVLRGERQTVHLPPRVVGTKLHVQLDKIGAPTDGRVRVSRPVTRDSTSFSATARLSGVEHADRDQPLLGELGPMVDGKLLGTHAEGVAAFSVEMHLGWDACLL